MLVIHQLRYYAFTPRLWIQNDQSTNSYYYKKVPNYNNTQEVMKFVSGERKSMIYFELMNDKILSLGIDLLIFNDRGAESVVAEYVVSII